PNFRLAPTTLTVGAYFFAARLDLFAQQIPKCSMSLRAWDAPSASHNLSHNHAMTRNAGRTASHDLKNTGRNALATHNQLSHNQLSHNQLSHNQLSHNQLSHNQLSHNQLSHNQLSHNQFAHNQFAAQNFKGLNNFSKTGFNRNAFGNHANWNHWGG